MCACESLRPCFFASDTLVESSPEASVRHGIDMVLVRELTSGQYFGERKEYHEINAFNTIVYKISEIGRIALLGGYLAKTREDSRDISLNKVNVLATSRLWRCVVEQLYKPEFPDLKIEHQLIDNAALIMVKNTTQQNGAIIVLNLADDRGSSSTSKAI